MPLPEIHSDCPATKPSVSQLPLLRTIRSPLELRTKSTSRFSTLLLDLSLTVVPLSSMAAILYWPLLVSPLMASEGLLTV
ncbi:MAG: hypothetical protein BWX88_03621 [Planctomycetes bacterium ADurb.Bin126]|nr:MAG: hypothetical protein BWX88_03621 [Planctomycetes bacterium ADurb.Bin126]